MSKYFKAKIIIDAKKNQKNAKTARFSVKSTKPKRYDSCMCYNPATMLRGSRIAVIRQNLLIFASNLQFTGLKHRRSVDYPFLLKELTPYRV